jgi:hypothetical protein
MTKNENFNKCDSYEYEKTDLFIMKKEKYFEIASLPNQKENLKKQLKF